MSSSENLTFKRALIVAGAFHFLLFAVLIVRFSFSSEDKSTLIINPDHTPIQATLINENELKAQAKRQADLERQKHEEKLAAERKIEAEKQKIAEEKRQAELKKQQLIAEQKRQEEAKQQAAKAAQAEKQKKLAQEKAEKQKATELAKKAAADIGVQHAAPKSQTVDRTNSTEAQAAAAKQAAEAAAKSAAQRAEALAEIERYKAMVRQQIARYWVVQKGLDQPDPTKLFVRLAPTGTVLDVRVTKSSGNDALDRSAVAAVYKASPLPVPKDPELFREFRELQLNLRPDSILSDS